MISDAQLPLTLLIGAAVCLYVGTHVLWRGFGGHLTPWPLRRGMLLVAPVGLVALAMPFLGRPGMGVSIVMAGSMLLITLTLGVTAMSSPSPAGFSSSSLRLLPPLCAGTFLVGLSGELSILHALALGAMAIMLLWSDAGRAPRIAVSAINRPLVGIAAIVMLGGAVTLGFATDRLLQIPIVPLLGQVIVPLCLLAAIGLLVGDVHSDAGEQATDSIVGAILLLLGFALPLVILVAHALALYHKPEAGFFQGAVIVMPMASWRLDSVFLTVLSALLLPVGLGRMSLGRLEGIFLVVVCVFYMIVSVSTARS